MLIYTTYFANVENLPKHIVPIAICGKRPKYWKGASYPALAPKYWFFKKYKEDHDKQYYTKCFKKEVLAKKTQKQVIDDLKIISKGKDIALVCYEKPEDFCHRHLVASWLTSAGFITQEY